VGKMSEAELAVRSLTQLAADLHCSERHFSRLFREEFNISLRARQTELRLQRARQLLAESDAKIINVAYESGYRHLGLFNAMFKRRFGVTPSHWRQQNLPAANPGGSPPKRPGLQAMLVFWLLWQIFMSAGVFAQSTNAPAGGNAAPHFRVDNYQVSGNTMLKPEELARILTNQPSAYGTNVTFDDIRGQLGNLQMAYRERGFVTVSVTLPQQRLTNATVKVKVTEGRLSHIKVEGNKWFSTENVLRALPGIRTNMLLNSHVFQGELDTANSSRDRQIYPVIGPGPDPGTSELTLKVKDRLPLHSRTELNDVSTPGTPFTRVVYNIQYGNLWDLEHQVGASYSFSPVDFRGKGSSYYWWPLDLPVIANYSLYYRLPLGPVQDVQQQIEGSGGHFGYNEVTHQFQMPPPSGRPDLTLYASRSVSDTGVVFNNETNLLKTPLLSISSFDSGQNITLNENIGAKFSLPLPQWGNLASTFAMGIDMKHYSQLSFNSNNFAATTLVTNGSGQVTPITSFISSGQPTRLTEVYYVPINAGISGSLPDPWGTTFFNAQANLDLGTFGGQAVASLETNRFQWSRSVTKNGLSSAAGHKINENYVTVQMGGDRVQRIYKDWNVKLHADGQLANGSLFSNEQFAMGGTSGVRGYQDGKAYGDAGWRVSVEPQTPMVQIGAVDGDTPLYIRASVFFDYGQVYLMGGQFFSEVASLNGPVVGRIPGDPSVVDMMGAGWALSFNIGNHLDGRLSMGFPLLNTGEQRGFSPLEEARIYFALGGQF